MNHSITTKKEGGKKMKIKRHWAVFFFIASVALAFLVTVYSPANILPVTPAVLLGLVFSFLIAKRKKV